MHKVVKKPKFKIIVECEIQFESCNNDNRVNKGFSITLHDYSDT